MLKIKKVFQNDYAKYFCKEFTKSDKPKYIFGRNEYGKSIANLVEIDGYIDDFTSDKFYLEKPIVSIKSIPSNALVVSSVVVGKPLLAEKRLKQFQFNSLDYYSFYKYSNLSIEPITYWNNFIKDFEQNRHKYNWIYGNLQDSISKNQLSNILNFRFSYNLDYMRGFTNLEDKQYFEDFLGLQKNNETFVDVGAYDGYTTEEFIKKSPGYNEIYLFEPDNKNLKLSKKKLNT